MAAMWNRAAARQQRDENGRARLARGNSAPRPTRGHDVGPQLNVPIVFG